MLGLMSDKTLTLIGRRYALLNIIGEGGMGCVYRAFDRLEDRMVALKRLARQASELELTSTLPTLVSNSHSTSVLTAELRLAHEFEILASLRHQNIISVLNYGFEGNLPYFSMDLLEDAQTIIEAGRDQNVEQRVHFFIQLLEALDYLQRRRIIHCDLKPDNVLIINHDQVKVLDFGLSISGEGKQHGGTLPYTAPEILRGEHPNVTSDLYAVGVLVHEMITGRVPFLVEGDYAATAELILRQQLDLRLLGPFASIASKLLDKNAATRCSDPQQAIFELRKLTTASYSMIETRESILQAGQFIGRDNELQQLSKALQESLDGFGSAWVISGESGVGKSRLLKELETQALVEGTLVMRGQGVSEGSTPYQIWRPILRWLCLISDLNDFQAGVLRNLVPDIDRLLGRDVPILPEIEAGTTQKRLLKVIVDLFSDQQQPLMLILEDLHWTGDESLIVLSSLSRMVSNLPLLIVSSFRSDEKPDLHSSLSGAHLLDLPRLNRIEIAGFAQAVFGKPFYQPQLLDVLERETEGNAFFLIETFRALSEEAGQLDKIAEINLPAHIFTTEMQNIIQRRINRVSAKDHELLMLAALTGRYLDLMVLAHLNSSINIEEWLTTCHNASVLDVSVNTWSFSHDKLREKLLMEISSSERIQLHQRIAVAIEQLYPDEPNQFNTLAYHWSAANNTEKEYGYSLLAAEQAFQVGANREAIRLFQRLLELDSQHQIPNPANRKLRRVQWERKISEAFFRLGELKISLLHANKAAELLGRPFPNNQIALIAVGLMETFIQAAHILSTRWNSFEARTSTSLSEDLNLEAARLFLHIAQIKYFFAHMGQFSVANIFALNSAERARVYSTQLAESYGTMAVITGIRAKRLLERYSSRAKNVLREIDSPGLLNTAAMVLSRTGIAFGGLGRLEEASQDLSESASIANRIGDHRMSRESSIPLAAITYWQGNYDKSIEICTEVHSSSQQAGDYQYELYALVYQAEPLMIQGELTEALSLLELALKQGTEIHKWPGPSSAISTYGLLSKAYLYAGRLKQAYQMAISALEIIEKTYITVFTTWEGYAAIIEVFLALDSVCDSSTQWPDLPTLTQKSLMHFRKFAYRFPVSEAQFLLWQGHVHWHSGHKAKALEMWGESLESANRLAMPLTQGLAHKALGSYGDPKHLEDALDIFTQLDADYYRTITLKVIEARLNIEK